MTAGGGAGYCIAMMDIRPIAYVVGRILIVFAIMMLVPAVVDHRAGLKNGLDFLQCAILTGGTGVILSLATRNSLGRTLDTRQAYVLTAAIWGVVPFFGALPFYLGAPELALTDAYFEAVSGITTTGASVISGLDDLPDGMNLWRAMLNWLGGLGIAIIAMIFLPVLRVGGMQYFRTEGFDTFGKALPRAADIAGQLLVIYLALTVLCIATYSALGMTTFAAVTNGASTISTGGFSPKMASFSIYSGALEYAGAVFMILGSLPYVRYVQLVNGQAGPMWRDRQVRAYLRWIAYAVGSVTLWRLLTSDMRFEPAFREALFNLVSIMSSTGFGSGSFASWGGYALVVAYVIGVIGACSGSSAAGLSVFRVQIAGAALLAQIRQIATPNRIVAVKYDGRNVDVDVLDSLILFLVGYILMLGVLTLAMTMLGVDAESAVWGVWATLGNIGYGFGPMIAATGTFVDYPDAAKWIMTLAMLMGRLGLMAILVLTLPRFWRP